MHPELKVLQEELAGKVALVFKDFTLDMHENAEKAAEAARCAGEQGRYWDFHDTLFHNSDRLEVPQLKQYARDLKLNQASTSTPASIPLRRSGRHTERFGARRGSFRVRGTCPASFLTGGCCLARWTITRCAALSRASSNPTHQPPLQRFLPRFRTRKINS